jgi:hypothetical protein
MSMMTHKVRITDGKGLDITFEFKDLVGAEYEEINGAHYFKVTVRNCMMGREYDVISYVHCDSEEEAKDMVEMLNLNANPDHQQEIGVGITYGVRR